MTERVQPWMCQLPGAGESAIALFGNGDLLGAIAAIKEEMLHSPADYASSLSLTLETYQEIKRIEDNKKTNDEIDWL